jgi:hypothetical protein
MFRFLKSLLVNSKQSPVDHAARNRDERASRGPASSAREQPRSLRLGVEHLEERITPGGGIWHLG